ncbi:MAG: lytic murein transglycosylase, partial [Pseudohongiellaceae bacterium]
VSPGCRALRHHTKKLPLSQWRSLGFEFDSSGLGAEAYAMVIPDEEQDISYLVGGNFRTILSYNCANKYAVSVGLLADYIVTDRIN